MGARPGLNHIYACKALDIKLVYMNYNSEIGMCNIELRQAVHKNAMRYCIFDLCIFGCFSYIDFP